jgi:ferric-dicitrate binding protein FerR (iron transport regulator)
MQDNVTQIFNSYLSGKLTEEERQVLITLLSNEEAAAQFETLLQQQLAGYNDAVHEQLPATENRIIQGILQKINAAPPVRRIRLQRVAAWAAAAILLIGIGMYKKFAPSHHTPLLTNTNKHQSTDIAPGEEKAVLVLSNGTTITLDSTTHGAIARQGNTAIIKLANGSILYQPKGPATGNTITNTMRTPRGGQYQLTLPDGTQVWLNAASSITYPVAFAEKERIVTISGEAYFEVAPLAPGKGGKKIPFKVIIPSLPGGPGGATIEVTGTHFNVNSYTNENSVTTTLLEGSVKVSVAGATAPVMLRAGQQARAHAQRIAVVNNADIDKVMAWKNGLFNFENVGLEEAMRQIERWYNVDVVYEKGVPDISFEGAISRNITLSNLLKVLARADVKFRIDDGRRLVVLP